MPDALVCIRSYLLQETNAAASWLWHLNDLIWWPDSPTTFTMSSLLLRTSVTPFSGLPIKQASYIRCRSSSPCKYVLICTCLTDDAEGLQVNQPLCVSLHWRRTFQLPIFHCMTLVTDPFWWMQTSTVMKGTLLGIKKVCKNTCVSHLLFSQKSDLMWAGMAFKICLLGLAQRLGYGNPVYGHPA